MARRPPETNVPNIENERSDNVQDVATVFMPSIVEEMAVLETNTGRISSVVQQEIEQATQSIELSLERKLGEYFERLDERIDAKFQKRLSNQAAINKENSRKRQRETIEPIQNRFALLHGALSRIDEDFDLLRTKQKTFHTLCQRVFLEVLRPTKKHSALSREIQEQISLLTSLVLEEQSLLLLSDPHSLSSPPPAAVSAASGVRAPPLMLESAGMQQSVDNCPLSRKTATAVGLVEEWFEGLRGRPSVVSRSVKLKNWQGPMMSFFKRRKALINFISAQAKKMAGLPDATEQNIAKHLDEIRREHKQKLNGLCAICQNVKKRAQLAEELRVSWAARPHIHAEHVASPESSD